MLENPPPLRTRQYINQTVQIFWYAAPVTLLHGVELTFIFTLLQFSLVGVPILKFVKSCLFLESYAKKNWTKKQRAWATGKRQIPECIPFKKLCNKIVYAVLLRKVEDKTTSDYERQKNLLCTSTKVLNFWLHATIKLSKKLVDKILRQK